MVEIQKIKHFIRIRVEFRGKKEPIIADKDRLVPKDFKYGPPEIEQDFLHIIDGPLFPGYAKQGLTMTKVDYDAWENGDEANGIPPRDVRKLIGTPEARPLWFVGEHPNRYRDGRLKPNAKPYDGTQVFPPGTFDSDLETASDGSPLHPFLKAALAGTKRGLSTGPVFYYELGAGGENMSNEAADMVYLLKIKGKARVLLIEGDDGRGWALPGGHIDAKDKLVSKNPTLVRKAAAVREAKEEAGIEDFEGIKIDLLCETIPTAEWRAGAQAWSVTTGFLARVDEKIADKIVLKAGSDARKAEFVPVEKLATRRIFPHHLGIIKLAFLKDEELTGDVIAKDGRVGRSLRDRANELHEQVKKYIYPHVGEIQVITRGDTTYYLHNDEVIYSSVENNNFTFDGLGGFLGTKNPDRQIEVHTGGSKDIALFGTINNNLPGVSAALDWMKIIQDDLGADRVFNPNKGAGTQSSGEINMQQFAEEAKHLFESKVVFMNFEPRRGGLALAELRMAFLASIITGRKLILRIEQPIDDENIIRSRALALADVEFFKQKFPNSNVEVIISNIPTITDEEIKNGIGDEKRAKLDKEYHECSKKIAEALKDVNNYPSIRLGKLPFLEQQPVQDKDTVVLSGSSRSARDLAIRLELIRGLEKIGKKVIDTYKSSFGSVPAEFSIEERMQATYANRIEELETMFEAKEQLVYVGKDSLSPFAQVATALLIAALTGSKISVKVDREVDRENFSSSDYRALSAKAMLSEKLYQEMKVGNLLREFEARGIMPELSEQFRAISDAIQPVVDGYK